MTGQLIGVVTRPHTRPTQFAEGSYNTASNLKIDIRNCIISLSFSCHMVAHAFMIGKLSDTVW